MASQISTATSEKRLHHPRRGEGNHIRSVSMVSPGRTRGQRNEHRLKQRNSVKRTNWLRKNHTLQTDAENPFRKKKFYDDFHSPGSFRIHAVRF